MKAEAIHINAIIRGPNVATMLTSEVPSKTFLKMENMAVATTDAAMVMRAFIKEMIVNGKERKRMKMPRR